MTDLPAPIFAEWHSSIPPTSIQPQERSEMYGEAWCNLYRHFYLCRHHWLSRDVILCVARTVLASGYRTHVECARCSMKMEEKSSSRAGTSYLCFCRAGSTGVYSVTQTWLAEAESATFESILSRIEELMHKQRGLFCPHITFNPFRQHDWSPNCWEQHSCDEKSWPCSAPSCSKEVFCNAVNCDVRYSISSHREFSGKHIIARESLLLSIMKPLGTIPQITTFRSEHWKAHTRVIVHPQIINGSFQSLLPGRLCYNSPACRAADVGDARQVILAEDEKDKGEDGKSQEPPLELAQSLDLIFC